MKLAHERKAVAAGDDWRRNFYALWFAQLLTIFAFAFLMPFMPLFLPEVGIRDLGEVARWSGILVAVPSFGLAISAPFWGVLADYRGRKLMVQRAMLASFITCAATAFARNVYDVLALRLVQGFTGGTIIAIVTLAASVSPGKRLGRNLGLMQAAVFGGLTLGPLLGGVLAARVGYRPVFFIAGMLVLLGTVMVTALVHERFERPLERPSFFKFLADFRSALTLPGIPGMLLFVFGVNLASVATYPIVPLVVQSMIGPRADVSVVSGLVFGANGLSSALTATFISRCNERWGYRNIVVCSIVGAAILTLPQALVGNPVQFAVLFALQGAFVGALMPMANVLIARAAPPERQGAIFGVISSAMTLGQAVGPLMSGVLAASTGLPSVFFLTAGLFVISGIGAAAVKTIRQSDRRRP